MEKTIGRATIANMQVFVAYLKRTAKIILFLVVCVLVARSFVVAPGRVNGRSMEPTFYDEETFLVNKFTLLYRQPRRGEIIQFVDPERNELVIKRVIGLPGEQVRIAANQVTIFSPDGRTFVLDEPYLGEYVQTYSDTRFAKTYPTVPTNGYFLMGDNREHSTDSREIGPVGRGYITGLVIRLPFSR